MKSFKKYSVSVDTLDTALVSINKPSEKEEHKKYFGSRNEMHEIRPQGLVTLDATLNLLQEIIEGSR